MKINLTYNNKPLIEPKSLISYNQNSSSVYFLLETNDDNIKIINDMKNNFFNISSTRTIFFIESKDKCYSFNFTSLNLNTSNKLDFFIILIDENKKLNQKYKELYLSFSNY